MFSELFGPRTWLMAVRWTRYIAPWNRVMSVFSLWRQMPVRQSAFSTLCPETRTLAPSSHAGPGDPPPPPPPEPAGVADGSLLHPARAAPSAAAEKKRDEARMARYYPGKPMRILSRPLTAEAYTAYGHVLMASPR